MRRRNKIKQVCQDDTAHSSVKTASEVRSEFVASNPSFRTSRRNRKMSMAERVRSSTAVEVSQVASTAVLVSFSRRKRSKSHHCSTHITSPACP